MRLAGELADGTVLTPDIPPDQIEERRRLVMDGYEHAGRTDQHRITANLLVATGPDAEARLAAEMPHDPDAGVPPWVAGDQGAIAAAVEERAAAGADAVVLQPPSDEDDATGFVQFVAEQVAALVAAGR